MREGRAGKSRDRGWVSFWLNHLPKYINRHPEGRLRARAVISARVGPRDLVFSYHIEFARMRETQGPSRLLARSAHSRAKAVREWGPKTRARSRLSGRRCN